MVAANTFRNPGLTAKLADDARPRQRRPGRSWASAAAGSSASTTRSGSTSAPALGERLDRLGEAARSIRRLLDGERVTHEGPLLPASRRRLRAAAGPGRTCRSCSAARGRRKTLPLVARHADLWNAYGSPDELAASDAILRAACEAIGRDEREIERTFNGNVVIRDSRAEAEAAWAGWLERHRPQAGEDRLNAFGTVEEVAGAARPLPGRRLPPRGADLPDAVRPRDDGPAAGAPGGARRLSRRSARDAGRDLRRRVNGALAEPCPHRICGRPALRDPVGQPRPRGTGRRQTRPPARRSSRSRSSRPGPCVRPCSAGERRPRVRDRHEAALRPAGADGFTQAVTVSSPTVCASARAHSSAASRSVTAGSTSERIAGSSVTASGSGTWRSASG